MTPPGTHAVHLAHGDSAGGTVRMLDAGMVLVRRDLLTVGVCDLDPVRHRSLRRAQWKIDDAEARAGLIGQQDLSAALAEHRDAPLVLWTTPTSSSRTRA